MARETRIGLLIGLVFIVVFGLVLSELTTPQKPVPASDEINSAYRHTYVIDETASASGERTIRISRRPRAAQISSGRPPAASPARQSGMPTARATQVQRAPGERITTYAVQRGDTLIGIARKIYGVGQEQQYRRIFQANRRILSDEGTVTPGQVLVIPPLSHNRPAPGGTVAPDIGEPRRHSETNLRSPHRPIAAAITRRPDQRLYVVKRGQTLQEVAYAFYRDDSRRSVMKIYEANEEKLRGLDELPTGMALAIPR